MYFLQSVKRKAGSQPSEISLLSSLSHFYPNLLFPLPLLSLSCLVLVTFLIVSPHVGLSLGRDGQSVWRVGRRWTVGVLSTFQSQIQLFFSDSPTTFIRNMFFLNLFFIYLFFLFSCSQACPIPFLYFSLLRCWGSRYFSTIHLYFEKNFAQMSMWFGFLCTCSVCFV